MCIRLVFAGCSVILGHACLYRNHDTSYLTSWPSPTVVHAGHQISTREWWDNHRDRYDLYTSLVTHQEAGSGDPDAARRRMNALEDIPMLAVTPECESIAQAILAAGLMPLTADRDALHIGVATFHGMDILLTWNIRHIANANIRRELRDLIRSLGYADQQAARPETTSVGEPDRHS